MFVAETGFGEGEFVSPDENKTATTLFAVILAAGHTLGVETAHMVKLPPGAFDNDVMFDE